MDLYWVVWTHTGLGKYEIKKGLHLLHNPCLRGKEPWSWCLDLTFSKNKPYKGLTSRVVDPTELSNFLYWPLSGIGQNGGNFPKKFLIPFRKDSKEYRLEDIQYTQA